MTRTTGLRGRLRATVLVLALGRGLTKERVILSCKA